MNKIVTLTFNPAIDKSTTVPELIPEKKLSCTIPVYQPGGGGINVARASSRLGGDVIAVYLAGGYTGNSFNELLKKEEVECIVTRTGIPVTVFDELVEIAKHKNAKLIVDTSGEALKQAVSSGVYLIKPNLRELSALTGRDLSSEVEIIGAAQWLIKYGSCQVIVVSLGAEGALLVTAKENLKILPPSVKVMSTVGAGDSMVAGIVTQLSKGKELIEAFKYGIASGTAATLNAGTELCHPADVEALYNQL